MIFIPLLYKCRMPGTQILSFAPTVTVSSTDLWQTCGLRSRKHSNLQTPGQSQQQNPVNQVNLNTNSSSAPPRHGQQKQSAAFHRRPRRPPFLHPCFTFFFPPLPSFSFILPSLSFSPLLPSFLYFLPEFRGLLCSHQQQKPARRRKELSTAAAGA